FYLGFASGELRTERIVGATKKRLVGDQLVKPPQPQAREFEIQSALAQLFQQRAFYETRQAYLIQIQRTANENQKDDPNRNTKTPEVNTAQAQVVAYLSRMMTVNHRHPSA